MLCRWIGSVGGIVLIASGTRHLCGCHRNLRIVSKDYYEHLNRAGMNSKELIAHESLPLLRRYYLWCVVSLVCVLCIVMTQVLWYLWLILGVIGVWYACIPVGVVCLGGVLYVALIKSITVSTGGCVLLALAWMVKKLLSLKVYLLHVLIFLLNCSVSFNVTNAMFQGYHRAKRLLSVNNDSCNSSDTFSSGCVIKVDPFCMGVCFWKYNIKTKAAMGYIFLLCCCPYFICRLCIFNS